MNATPLAGVGFLLRFPSLFDDGRALAFPCNASGAVDLDGLPERARRNRFYAHTLIGRDFGRPTVCRAQPC